MIFPGQGAQFIGMCKEFYDQSRIVQEYFEQASQCLDKNFVKLCFASSEKELMETVNTQTSIFLVSAAITTLLKQEHDITPSIVAGHSLGEYSALYAAGGINFPDALYLLSKRAQFMEEATSEQNGGMLAVLNFPEDKLRSIIQRYDQPESLEHVAQIVNYNSPRQLVVSGTMPELLAIKEDISAARGRSVMLKVAGGFHSRLMQEAESRFGNYLIKVDLHNLTTDLVNNVEARIISVSDEVKSTLVKQISSPVLWWQSMQSFKECDLIIQVGPCDTYAKMLQKEWPEKTIIAINNLDDINKTRTILGRPMISAPVNEIMDEAEVI